MGTRKHTHTQKEQTCSGGRTHHRDFFLKLGQDEKCGHSAIPAQSQSKNHANKFDIKYGTEQVWHKTK